MYNHIESKEKSSTIIEVKNLSKHFGGIHAVSNCSIKIKEHEVVGLIGPNGAGKTTLINLITGLEIPDSGRVIFNSIKDITCAKPFERYRIGISRTFQIGRLFYSLKVFDNLELAKVDLDIAEQYLKIFKIDKNAKIINLSVGQQKLVEFIRTISSKNKMILLDEPFSGTSKEFRQIIFETIKENSYKKTFLMTDHDLDTIFQVSTRILIMDKGNILEDILPEDREKSNIYKVIYNV